MRMSRAVTVFLAFVFLVVGSEAKSEYSDKFTREYFPTIFASTEATEPSLCLGKLFRNYTLKTHYIVKCDETRNDTCSGLSLASHDKKAIILAFRGTTTLEQLDREGLDLVFKKKKRWLGGGNVAHYFGNAFMQVWRKGMNRDVFDLTRKYPGYEVWLGGHSLGGAMAAVASNYLAAGIDPPSSIKLITFGQPRTGDKAFADAHDKFVPYSFRIVHKRDIVSHLPFKGMVGYHHHRSEIWYNNDMSKADFKECDAQESPHCSDSLFYDKVADHHQYFGVGITNYGKGNCKGDPSGN